MHYISKGHVLHKQLLHYSIGSRILSLSYYILLILGRESEGFSVIISNVSPFPPYVESSEFTKAFQHAADRIQAHASFDHFDGSGERLVHYGLLRSVAILCFQLLRSRKKK